MEKITVKFFKVVGGREELRTTMEFDTLAEALKYAEEWASRTTDNTYELSA